MCSRRTFCNGFAQIQPRVEAPLSSLSRGVLLALVSTALFVWVGVIVRILGERIDLFQILLFRQIIFVVLLTPAMLRSAEALIRPRLIRLHLLRISGAFAALYLGFVTVSNLPLADATALGFTQVLFVAAIARLLLAEPVGIERSLTLSVGFVGVLMVIQPEFESAELVFILAGLTGALGAAVAVVCVRRLAKTESRIVILSYQAVFVGLIAFIPSLYSWQWPTPSELLLLVSVGIISSVAQWFGVTAYQKTEANIVANVEYVKIIYSMIFGYLLFAEIPDSLAIFGALLLVLSVFLPQLWRFMRALITKLPRVDFKCH